MAQYSSCVLFDVRQPFTLSVNETLSPSLSFCLRVSLIFVYQAHREFSVRHHIIGCNNCKIKNALQADKNNMLNIFNQQIFLTRLKRHVYTIIIITIFAFLRSVYICLLLIKTRGPKVSIVCRTYLSVRKNGWCRGIIYLSYQKPGPTRKMVARSSITLHVRFMQREL